MSNIYRKLNLFWVGLIVLGAVGLGAPLAVARDGSNRAVPDVLIYADPGVEPASGDPGEQRVVIVDKQRQRVNLYGFRDYWRNLAQWPCSTGKIRGPKQLEGDQKTPEGIFFAVRDVGERYLTPVYGARALPLDYPNWLDRRRNRRGSAIWLHGTNRSLQPFDSNGCVVLENESIDQLAQYIRLHRTPVIIVDRIRLSSVRKSRAAAKKILNAVDLWNRALMYGDYSSFSHWYDNRHKPDMVWWQRWCRQRRIYGTGDTYRGAMEQRAIYRQDQIYVMLFDHVLLQNSRQARAGRRKLYLAVHDGEVRIMGETYQPVNVKGDDPLFLAWRKLWQVADEPRKLAAGRTGEQES